MLDGNVMQWTHDKQNTMPQIGFHISYEQLFNCKMRKGFYAITDVCSTGNGRLVHTR